MSTRPSHHSTTHALRVTLALWVGCCILACLLVALMFEGTQRWVIIGVGGAIAIVVVVLLERRPKWGCVCVIVFASVPLLLCLVQTARRLAFIAHHGGMDSAEEPGSPMAFLIGWVFEWFVLGGPTSVLIVTAAAAFRSVPPHETSSVRSLRYSDE